MSQETRRAPLLSRPAPAFLFVLLAILAAAAAARALLMAHAERELSKTGKARWIWYTKDVREPAPLRFFATRDILLRTIPTRATAKVFVDRRHVLRVNGGLAGEGEQKPGDPLVVYDVAPLLRPGINRIGIEAESPTGVGGILFALDLAGAGRNAVVSDGRWRVDLSRRALREGARFRAAVWGRPPMHPWGYPRMPRPGERRDAKRQSGNEVSRSARPAF